MKTAYPVKNIGGDPPTEAIMRRSTRDLAENHAPDGQAADPLDKAANRELFLIEGHAARFV